MTRRHDERWAIPIGNDEYIQRMEEEFHRLRQVERTLEGQVDFLRSERDRLRDAVEELRARNNGLLSSEEAEITRLRTEAEDWRIEALRVHKWLQEEVTRLQQALIQIADPEVFDLDARAMRVAARQALSPREVST